MMEDEVEGRYHRCRQKNGNQYIPGREAFVGEIEIEAEIECITSR
jgi:hypothetical protein